MSDDHPATSVPAAVPGAAPTQQTVIRCANQYGLPADQFAAELARVNEQLILVGNAWGFSAVCQIAPADPAFPGILFEATNTYGYSGYTQNGQGFVGVDIAKAKGEPWEALWSHVALNLATQDRAGQPYEAEDYHLDPQGIPVQSPPWYLCNWAFPQDGRKHYSYSGLEALDYLGNHPVKAP